MKIARIFKAAILVTASILFLACCSLFSFSGESASADTGTDESYVAEEGDEGINPRLFTSLSLAINCGDGKVWATVKNDFTLFPSTVIVIVMLYSSDTYAESFEYMDYVCANVSNDLDMGNTLTVESPTGGEEKFWLARMRYKINNDDWESKQTTACRISADGEFLGYV